jgi:hypothetical protein
MNRMSIAIFPMFYKLMLVVVCYCMIACLNTTLKATTNKSITADSAFIHVLIYTQEVYFLGSDVNCKYLLSFSKFW